ncbi:MAG: CBS domain-containing protein, partial [Verrucomicrobiota bacterium]|nr:CBS domain-containing protein [Verrucomicrobiota bacterium]
MQTIVIGHRNPDMDSICSAIAYAELKRLTGTPDVIAARAGNTNERIDFVLEKFGVEPPLFISDLSPRVADVMEREVISVHSDCSAYEAIHLIEKKRLRGLPVVDEKNRCLGLLSAFRISHQLFPPREEVGSARRIVASLGSLVETFGGSPIAGRITWKTADLLLMVGAMDIESFSRKLDDHCAQEVVLFVGDREEIQRRAIAANVRALVITGGLGISPGIRAEAERAGVVVISSPHDTATSVLLARGAVKVERMLSAELATFRAETSLEEARETAAASRHFIFPVVDEHGALVGILSKSDFLKTIPRQLILVDHNELSQAVHG